MNKENKKIHMIFTNRKTKINLSIKCKLSEYTYM